MPGRVSFLIDGFNVYHSILAAIRDTGLNSSKWLDYHSLCKSLITDVGHLNGCTLQEIYYFTALAHHAGIDVVQRHKVFIKALESKGIHVVKGNFKDKRLMCKVCHNQYIAHEEKETDVHIALQLIECCLSDECDTAVLVTGDTDLVAAVATARRLYPSKQIGIVFPYRRFNGHFKKVASFTAKLSSLGYRQHQFPDPIIFPDGSVIAKPATW